MTDRNEIPSFKIYGAESAKTYWVTCPIHGGQPYSPVNYCRFCRETPPPAPQAPEPVCVSKKESYMYDGLYAYYAEFWTMGATEPEHKGFGTGYDGRPADWSALEVATEGPEVDAYKRYNAERNARSAAKGRMLHLMDAAARIEIGTLVRVACGRKVAIGTEGRVMWIEPEGGYGKIGIALDDTRDERGRFANVAWTYLRNVIVPAVIDGDADLPDFDELLQEQRRAFGLVAV